MEFLGGVWRWFSDPARWGGADGIPQRLVEHVQLSAESVAIGALIALPIGIVLGHYGRFGNVAINISNVGRALPSFGILVIAFQVFGLGDFPIVLPPTALAIPPILTNSYAALPVVDPASKDAARGVADGAARRIANAGGLPGRKHERAEQPARSSAEEGVRLGPVPQPAGEPRGQAGDRPQGLRRPAQRAGPRPPAHRLLLDARRLRP